MAADDSAPAIAARLQKWADGKSTLKEVRGYTDEELYSIARMGYFFFYQGKISEARTVFQGLYAVNPSDTYFAKALGVVEMAAGNAQGAAAAYDVALKIAPKDSAAYVGRAEVRLAMAQKPQAIDDLKKAQQFLTDSSLDKALNTKISAMLQALTKK
jgi:type III secretion system low calcium response chaperone LcrH/SycD